MPITFCIFYLRSLILYCILFSLQIVTVLANMAQSTSCFAEIVDNDGLSLLLTFLNIRPSAKLTEAELSACERVHQKSAIALTRLAKDSGSAKAIVAKGGKT